VKDDRIYLIHIGECITYIENFVADGREPFMFSRLIQSAVIWNLQTLAESSQRISSDIKAAHPEIDWRRMAGLRNILVHDYFGIDLELVWQIIEQNLPDLKLQVAAILRELETKGNQ
jgi:uncharacterized protein with HEPN domain